MTTRRRPLAFNRRQLLRGGVVLAGGVFLARAWPSRPGQDLVSAQPADQLAAMRAQMGAAPIESLKLTDTLTMLSGPGGNVVVSNGPDGKIVVDSFVQPAWDKLQQALDALGKTPVKALIDTHWHFDHADNNGNFRKLGAAVLAHENTTKRMSQTHEGLRGVKFPASPPDALPTQTFKDTHTMDANGEQIRLAYIPPAHTDTDISIRYAKANVLHLGDLYFAGMYPFIDGSTGGSIDGMVRGVDHVLELADASTKIVPGHGPLSDRASLTKYRDMMATVRDRVQKLKISGRKVEEVVAAKPTADLDAVWGQGFIPPDLFVAIVYGTL